MVQVVNEGLTGAQWDRLDLWLRRNRRLIESIDSMSKIMEHAKRPEKKANYPSKPVGARIAGLQIAHVREMAQLIGISLPEHDTGGAS